MKYDVKKMYEWPLLAQVFIMVLTALFIVYLGYFIDLVPMQEQVRSSDQQQEDLKQQFKVSLDQTVSITNSIQLLPKLQELLSLWEHRFISTAELPTLLDTILKYGQENGLKFNLFDPGTEMKAGKYTMIPLHINMSGSYDQISSFMSEVANMPKMVIVGNFSLLNENMDEELTTANPEPLNSDLTLTSDLTLEIYRL